MKVTILEVKSNKEVDAFIDSYKGRLLPDIHDGWRFNFRKHVKTSGANAYILYAEITPGKIEGCLIFKMREKLEPYMAYIEIAPSNRGKNPMYEKVAGCLIAFACRMSFIYGKGPYLGWLAFDVMEENKSDQRQLMTLYSKKYYANKITDTTMVISPEDGEILIQQYLGSNN